MSYNYFPFLSQMSVEITILKEIEQIFMVLVKLQLSFSDIIGVLAPPSSVIQWNGTTYCPLSEEVSVSIRTLVYVIISWYTVFPCLVRARTNIFSQSNYAWSNRGRELIKGCALLFQPGLFIMEHARLISIAKLNTK